MTDPRAVPPPSAPSSPPQGGDLPAVRLDLDAPLEVARWRPLVHWLLVIPYAIVVGILGFALALASIGAFFAVLFTRRVPTSLFRFMAMCLRVNWRMVSYQFFLREPYPGWDFAPSSTDPRSDPATLSFAETAQLNRWLPLVKWLLVIPHLVVLGFLGIGAAFVELIGGFAVLFTGRWPQGMRDYVVGFQRWAMRVNAYLFFMTDDYPPFSLS